MIKRNKLTLVQIVLGIACAGTSRAGDWTEPAELLHELKPCVSYRARLEGEFLVIHAALKPGWHTFAMDNKRRAAEKLAGKPSLGIDLPTEIKVTGGLEPKGRWYQSPPKDFSKPELRWFSWGFENQASFVTKVRRTGAAPAQIAIRGQACTESTCKNIDVAISLPLAGATAAAPFHLDMRTLVQVR